MTKIAILGGTGAMGGALALRFAKAGHQVWVGSRSAERGRDFAAELVAAHPGLAIAGDDLAGAAAAAEICFLTVPYAAHAETLEQIKAFTAGKIVVDTTAPLRPGKLGTALMPPAGSAALEAQAALGPDVRVISALQTIAAGKLAKSEPVDCDVLVAGNDAEAAASVCGLIEALGLRAWHVGPLANSVAAEAMTSVLIQINRRYKRSGAGLRITGELRDAPPTGGSSGVSVLPIRGLPLFAAGDDLAGAIAQAIQLNGLAPQPGDVIVVAQKVVSKVEGRAVAVGEVAISEAGRSLAAESGKPEAVAELIAGEASEIMRVRSGLVIARHRLGHVAANAGIDSSNVRDPAEPETVLLWPEDPDASAARLRAGLEAHFGVRLAVIVNDSLGRAWRLGTLGTAIGVAGMKPLRDRRGELDLFGRTLQATIVGVADELSAAASLVIGEAAEGVPAALIRGAVYDPSDDARAVDLVRPAEQDFFR